MLDMFCEGGTSQCCGPRGGCQAAGNVPVKSAVRAG